MHPDQHPAWVTVFVDSPTAAVSAEFWCRVTGWALSPWREDTFATFEPTTGTASLRVQRFDRQRIHLDLHVDDLDAWSDHAVELGADVVARPGHVILRSPDGFTFCLVDAGDSAVRARPAVWGRHSSLLDQVTLDIPADRWEIETSFWAAFTGWPLHHRAGPEFDRIVVPAAQPWRILLQRLDEVGGDVRAHLDIACDDRGAEVTRHLELGASVVGAGRRWTVLESPVGEVYCITDRDPRTGAVAAAE